LRLTQVFLILWGLQVIWLAWHFAPEARDLGRRISQRHVGAAVRQEDPLYRWAVTLAAIIPQDATYVFLDNYEAGKEIEARYFLAPRRHVLLAPDLPASFLFYALHREHASFLLSRDQGRPLGAGVQAASQSPALQPVSQSGAGLAFRVEPQRLGWGFYD